MLKVKPKSQKAFCTALGTCRSKGFGGGFFFKKASSHISWAFHPLVFFTHCLFFLFGA